MFSTSSCVLEVPERILKNLVGEMFFAEPGAFSFVNFPEVDSPKNKGAILRESVRGT